MMYLYRRCCTCTIIHCTVYRLHYKIYNVHYTIYIVYYTLYSVHHMLYHVYCTLYSVHYTLYSVHYTLYNVHYTLYNVHCTLYSVHCTLYSVYLQCTLSNITWAIQEHNVNECWMLNKREPFLVRNQITSVQTIRCASYIVPLRKHAENTLRIAQQVHCTTYNVRCMMNDVQCTRLVSIS